jgi:hypothetical protein
MKTFWHSVYGLVLALWVGGMAIFTFVLTPAIFTRLPRDQAGQVVGILFPFYFPYLEALAAAGLLTFLLAAPDRSRLAARVSVALLLGALAVDSYVTFKLHPDSVAVKRTVTSFEREPPDSPARRRFSRLHALSSVLNLAVLADGVALLLLAPALRRKGAADG